MTDPRGAIRSCAGTNPAPDANGSTSEVAPNPALTVGPNNDRTPEQKPGFTANDAQGAHSIAAPRPEALPGEARRNGPQPLTLDERTKIGEHLLSLLVLDAKFDRQRDLIVTWFRRYEATIAAVERERDDARRALEAVVGYVIWDPRLNRIHRGHVYKDRADAESAWKDIVWHARELYRIVPVAALAARPAETPEGR